MLAPEIRETVLGRAQVRQLFPISKVGTDLRLVRARRARSCAARGCASSAATTVLGEGTVSSLKRFKDDVREVLAGLECGIGVEGIKGVQPGDVIEAFTHARRSPARCSGRAAEATVSAARVAVGTVELHLPDVGSLKGKRHALKGSRTSCARRFEISVAEVDHHDVWQRATLALACVSGDSRHANEVDLQGHGLHRGPRGRARDRHPGGDSLTCKASGSSGSTSSSRRRSPCSSSASSRTRGSGFVTVTEVRPTPDLKHAKVFVSVLGDRGAVGRLVRGARERPRLRLELAAPPPRSARDARARLPARPLHGARRAHPGAARQARRPARAGR